MNLVGKIFVVLIFVMSVLFMAFAMAVYATHRNWREEVMRPPEQVTVGKELGFKFQLDRVKAENENLKSVKDKLDKELVAERAGKQQALAKLESELTVVERERKELAAEKDKLDKAQSEAVAAMSVTQKAATSYRQELDRLRTEVLQAQQDRDAHFKEVQRLTDELHQVQNDSKQLHSRMEDVGKDLTKAREALRYFDINENADFKAKNPPRVDGVVTATQGGGLIEISFGADDGLRVGHRLEVYRTRGREPTYVGRIEVVRTAPDRSVCKIDPNVNISDVVKGDRVASKID